MAEYRYRLMVRAVDLQEWVASAFGNPWRPMSWPEVLEACWEAMRSPGVLHRCYRVEEVRDV